MDNVEIIALHGSDRISDPQLEQIARLIYQTDPYIYPAMLGSLENAVRLLPAVFRSGRDCMFSLDNVHIAIVDGSVVSVLLTKKGKLSWSGEVLRDFAAGLGVELPGTLTGVQQEYMDDRYVENSEEDIISVINLCTDPEYRGRGIAELLFRRFINENRDAKIKLCVIKSNTPAVNLYRRLGFRETRQYPGYSAGSEKPRCLDMELDP